MCMHTMDIYVQFLHKNNVDYCIYFFILHRVMLGQATQLPTATATQLPTAAAGVSGDLYRPLSELQ